MEEAEATAKALSQITDTGIVGAFTVLIIIGWVWTVRLWLRTQTALELEKTGRLEDAKEYAKSGEASRATMTALEGTVRTMIDVLRERGRP